MWQELLGARSRPAINWIERGAVRRFAEAIGDPHPLYLDEEAAKRSRHGGLIAPPTFGITLDYGGIDGLRLPETGLLHGEQRISAVRPLRVGEMIMGQDVFEHYYEKQGGRGLLTFLVFTQTGAAESGDVVLSMRKTLIITETVRRRWEG
ncbi:MAG TPA: MaoC family dehydratase N-terminal domain-containing protein [Chloroflexota bacterium]|nr:MaoC family dehydratase N-terminal domain-containing protein [Chloroflexota bacterium]